MRRGTSIPLILLTLAVGVALGWALRSLLPAPAPQPAPTAVSAAPTAIPPTEPPAAPPTALPPPTAPPTALPPPAEPPTAAPPTGTPTEAPTEPPPTDVPATPAPEIAGYAAHSAAAGEDLARIAALGGSDPALIARYNRLAGEPQPGRPLIVPRLAGRESQLDNLPTLVQRGPAGRPWVALTLDAGASAAPTPRMLDALRERGVHVTFFLTGKWIRENPELARRIVAEGHEVANHTFDHPDLRGLDDAAIRRELEDTEAALREAVGEGATTRPFFRPPFGAYDERVLRTVQAAGYLPIYWTLDSLDSVGEPKTPEFLLQRVTGKLTPTQLRGAIILAHCGSEPTADALPQILDRFKELGLEVHTLSEVLGQ